MPMRDHFQDVLRILKETANHHVIQVWPRSRKVSRILCDSPGLAQVGRLGAEPNQVGRVNTNLDSSNTISMRVNLVRLSRPSFGGREVTELGPRDPLWLSSR
jgi:hypothetical protein